MPTKTEKIRMILTPIMTGEQIWDACQKQCISPRWINSTWIGYFHLASGNRAVTQLPKLEGQLLADFTAVERSKHPTTPTS